VRSIDHLILRRLGDFAVSLDTRPAADSRMGVVGIENEISNYRAISPMAIAAFVFGMATVLAFADLWFLVLGVLAVVAGFAALRKIGRMSDILTGEKMAKAGIALALAFSLSAVTMSAVKGYQVHRSASRFASGYAKVLAQGNLENAIFFRMPPDARKTAEPKAAFEEMKKNSPEPGTVESYTGPVKALLKTLIEDRHKVRFVELEQSGFDRLTPYAFALIELIPPEHDHAAEAGKAHDHDHAHDQPAYALLDLRGTESGTLDWTIQDIIYPYERKTATVKEKPLDDGHNH
jgi:hypothetical protein